LLFAIVPTLQQLEAFEREGKLLQSLEHPRIPRFVASFREGEGARTRLYLAQELVEGESLGQRLRSGTLEEARARDIARQVLGVLVYLHSRTPQVIHRDVKPHNLIASSDGSIKLVDFGAARELTDGATHQATLVGTYGYMPPEQIAGTVDQTNDLYALGATLMHLLTGRPPDKLVGEDLELAAGISLNVSAGFERFIRRLAAKSPQRRFPSAADALKALEALPLLSHRAGKARGWKAAALMAAAVGVAVAAGVMVKPRPAPRQTPSVKSEGFRVYAWEPTVTRYEAPNAQSARPPASAIPIGTELTVADLKPPTKEKATTVAVAWIEANDVHVRVWNGTAWQGFGSTGAMPRGPGRPEHVTVDLLPSGYPVVAYSHVEGTGTRHIYVRAWDGGAWSELGGSASGGGLSGAESAWQSAMSVDSQGRIVVAWQGQKLHVKRWNGSVWEPLGDSSAPASDRDADLCIGMGPSDAPFVSWYHDQAGNTGIFARGVQWNGTAWTELGSSNTGDGIARTNASIVRCAMRPDGFPAVGYWLGDAQVGMTQWNGREWASLPNIFTGEQPLNVALTVDSSSAPVMAWGTVSQQAIGVRRWNGTEWQDLRFPEGSRDPVLRAHPGGGVVLAYESGMIHVTRWDGSRWRELGTGVSGGANPMKPSLAVRVTDVVLPPPEFYRVLSPGSGFVRISDVRPEPPIFEKLFEQTRTALGEARLSDVEADGERARALRPQEREPLTLLLALYNAQLRADAARRVSDLLTALGPAPAPAPSRSEPRAGPDPRKGEHWFVGASSLRLRKRPVSDGKVLADLPVNTELEVLGLEGEWARVKWMSSAATTLEFSFEKREESGSLEEKAVEGFVAHAYLAREKVEKEWTLSKAQAAQDRGDATEAVRQLARAAALTPVDRELQLRLAKAAVATRDYTLAAKAAVAAHELSKGLGEPLVEMRLAYVCRGNRARAEWIDDSADVSRMPVDACIESLTQQQCEPCDCGDSEEPEPSMGSAGECRSDVELIATCTEGQRCVDQGTANAHCVDVERPPSEMDQYREAEANRVARREEIDQAFPAGSWLRVKVTGPALASLETSRVIVYTFNAEESRTPDEIDDGEDSSQCQSVSVSVDALETVPTPGPGQEVTFWVQVPSYEDTTYGVAFGRSAREVAARLESEYASCGAGEPARTVHRSTSARDCGGCHCT
jgi:hypothetical protein